MTTPAPQPSIGAQYYSSLMVEAIGAIVTAHNLANIAERIAADNDSYEVNELRVSAGMYGRYAAFTALFAFEAGGNSLLANLRGARKALIEDFDDLKTLLKYELFALVNATPLDRSIDHYGNMVQIIRLRNSWVHPRLKQVKVVTDAVGGYRVDEAVVGCRSYPAALEFIEPRHAIDLVRDILRFISWVVFDSCGYSVSSGADLLSQGQLQKTDSVYFAHESLGFDVRTFGIE
jgi:hypothetical protein